MAEGQISGSCGRGDAGQSGGDKNVTLVAVNELKEPRFRIQENLLHTASQYLIGMLEEAAKQDDKFGFTATYDGRYGYYVDAINKTFGNYALDKSFWQILGNDSKPISVGVSSFVPDDKDTITFQLVKDSPCKDQ